MSHKNNSNRHTLLLSTGVHSIYAGTKDKVSTKPLEHPYDAFVVALLEKYIASERLLSLIFNAQCRMRCGGVDTKTVVNTLSC